MMTHRARLWLVVTIVVSIVSCRPSSTGQTGNLPTPAKSEGPGPSTAPIASSEVNETGAGGASGSLGGMASDQPEAAITELLPIAVPDAPIELVDIRRRSGTDSDVLLFVENRANQPVTFVSYHLMFPACAKLEHAPARWISYGDRSLLDARQVGKPKDPPIAPRGRAELVVPHDVLQTFRRTIDEKCLGKGPPELVLARVAFADTTGWETFGKSSGYAGRPWKPRSGATPQK